VQAGENVIIGSKAVEKAQEAVGKIKELLEKDETSNLKAAANAYAAKEAEILLLTAQKSNSLVYQGRSSRENIDGCFWAT
jgi:predicted dinucleotide-binding enzyme